MKNPLDSILGTIISGIIITIVLFFIAKNFLGTTKAIDMDKKADVMAPMEKTGKVAEPAKD